MTFSWHWKFTVWSSGLWHQAVYLKSKTIRFLLHGSTNLLDCAVIHAVSLRTNMEQEMHLFITDFNVYKILIHQQFRTLSLKKEISVTNRPNIIKICNYVTLCVPFLSRLIHFTAVWSSLRIHSHTRQRTPEDRKCEPPRLGTEPSY